MPQVRATEAPCGGGNYTIQLDHSALGRKVAGTWSEECARQSSPMNRWRDKDGVCRLQYSSVQSFGLDARTSKKAGTDGAGVGGR